MTIQRWDIHSTEFGLWLRKQLEIDSKLGYRATNIDYYWTNTKTGKFMIIEEKRHMAEIKPFQRIIFQIIHDIFRKDKNYCGIYLIQFTNTNPDDGKCFLNREEISKENLIKFLRFENYKS